MADNEEIHSVENAKSQMRKGFLIVALLVLITFVPLHYSFAAMDGADETFTKQITAIGDYVRRIFGQRSIEPLTDDDLRKLIKNGNEWFHNTQMESGRFNYEFAPYKNEYLEDDHIVRQGGVLYALGEIARRDKDETISTNETIEEAAVYFESISREDIEGAYTFKCITHNEISTICPLGATSLALIGILSYLEQHPEDKSKYEDLIESYVNYVLAMKKPDEGFRDQHRIGSKNQSDNESSFSNGEAILALARYYAFYSREDVKEVIDAAFMYLKEKEYDVPLYLWIMAALKGMHELWPNEAYITYAKTYTDWRVSRASRFRGTNKNYCAYIEGVVSAYSLLYDSLTDAERTALRSEIDYWNTKNSWLQIRERDAYRIIPEDDTLTIGHLENPMLAYGGFLTGEEELTQRIDFTQHCVSAYLQTLVDIDGGKL